MPSIAAFHPQIVHFVVALAIVGVALRLVSFTPWFTFASPAARTLIVLSALAGYFAAESGHQAHESAERIPGVGPAVGAHEDAGEWARDALLVVAGIELIGWALTSRPKAARAVMAVSAVAGLGAVGAVYKAAHRGGILVYSYAGGVGMRTGDTSDVSRLLTAGLYNEAMVDRQAGRDSDAARLIDLLAGRHPGDPQFRLLQIESTLRDLHQPRQALAALDSVTVAPNDRRTMFRVSGLRSDAYLALGKRDSARAALETMQHALGPNGSPRLQARIDSLK